MGHHLAKAALLVGGLGGCSLIYSPGSIPDPLDANIDTPIADANPDLLELTSVESSELLEGQGDGGSAPALLVVFGHHIEGASVTVAPVIADPKIKIDVGTAVIANDGNSIAVPVTAHVVEMLDEGAPIPLLVTVSQRGMSATVDKTIPWTLKPLNELKSPATIDTATNLKKLYSKVEIGDVTFTGNARAVVRAVSSIRFGNIQASAPKVHTASAANADAGPGGCAGGGPGSPGSCSGAGGAASSGGGGGAGFVEMGKPGAGSGAGAGGPLVGDPLIAGYALPGTAANAASGGGGGGGGLNNGGPGGGGGGTVELTAGGDVTVGTIAVQGAPGAVAKVLMLGGGGGGGAGGVVLLRAGRTLVAGAVTAKGGTGGAGGLDSNMQRGGLAADGRTRFDAVTGVVADAHRGPMIVRPMEMIVRTAEQSISLVGTLNDRFSVTVGSTTTQGQFSAATTTVKVTLAIGHNNVCVVVDGGRPSDEEAKNCIELALVP